MNLHPEVNETDVIDFFSIYGRIESVHMIQDPFNNLITKFCYVTFVDPVFFLSSSSFLFLSISLSDQGH